LCSVAQRSTAASGGWLSSLFSSSASASAVPNPSSIKGLYLWGGVGCGKTFIMDLFYNSLPSTLPRRRVHFHEFMLDVHSRCVAALSHYVACARTGRRVA
jgi:protein AFG1